MTEKCPPLLNGDCSERGGWWYALFRVAGEGKLPQVLFAGGADPGAGDGRLLLADVERVQTEAGDRGRASGEGVLQSRSGGLRQSTAAGADSVGPQKGKDEGS